MKDPREKAFKYMAQRAKADTFEVPELMDLITDIQAGRKKIGKGIPISDCKKRILWNLSDKQREIIGITNIGIESRNGEAFLVEKKERGPKNIIIFTRKAVKPKVIRRRKH